MSCTSIKARPILTASALPPCHRTCAAASLQAVAGLRSPTFNRFLPEWQDHCLRPTCLSTKVQSATLPQRAKGTTFTSVSPSLPLPTPLAACASRMVIHDLSSPALQTGFIRATSELDDNGAPTKFQEVSILVDSGSQQAPLCCTSVAEKLGTTGKLSSFAPRRGANRCLSTTWAGVIWVSTGGRVGRISSRRLCHRLTLSLASLG